MSRELLGCTHMKLHWEVKRRKELKRRPSLLHPQQVVVAWYWLGGRPPKKAVPTTVALSLFKPIFTEHLLCAK